MSCFICGCGEARLIKKEGAWDVVQCKNCSFVYITPLPDEQFLHLHYQTYLPAGDAYIEQWREMMQDVFQRSLDAIEARHGLNRGTLLDIGCGYGFFLELARQKEWSVYGMEPCAHARAYAASKSLKIDSEDIFVRAYKDEMFDVITLFYVLEHLPNPIKYLKEINRILKPGGLLLVRVPHTTPIVKLLKILGIPNRLYDVPSHLSDFSPCTIALALEKTGFNEIQTFPGGATRPHALMKRIVSCSSGLLADALYALSGKKLLIPGVSKTTIARKPGYEKA
ncbi:MAG: class I SAM-dependent methyltransferase [Candidatus Taylorbacteria bacterium]|nr:class I SAM-dependent methyltransferase [Candidatus Taylorbacteria bacterium]